MKTETSKATHTPGPWNIQDNTTEPYGQLLVESAVHGAVSICYTMEKGETRAPAEYVQNARLMSAAPELLEALKVMVSHWPHYAANMHMTQVDRDAIGLARAAIAKATGADIG